MPYEPEFHRQGAVLLTQTGDASVWQFRNETGEGTMTTYELFPGVALSFNDFHMASFDSSFSTRQRLFAVDYCREGRMGNMPQRRQCGADRGQGGLPQCRKVCGRF